MRQSIAALAIIHRDEAGQRHWLTQRNRRWNALALVGGHKLPHESFRECLMREMGEELHLREGVDFTLTDAAPRRLEFTAWSQSAQQETAYTIELFEVGWLSEDALRKINANHDNAWLTEAQIRQGRSEDGGAVSDTVLKLLTQAGLLKKA